MSRLFISNSEARPTLRAFFLTIALTAVLLASCDIVAFPFVSNAITDPPDILPDYRNAAGVDALWHMRAAGLRPIVFTGSSQTETGISPHLFDDQLAVWTGEHVTSVNVSFVGASSVLTRDAMRGLLAPLEPSMIIYGIEMRALNQNALTLVARFVESPLGYVLHLEPGLEQTVLLWLAQHSTFFRYRGNLSMLLSNRGRSLIMADDRGFTALDGVSNASESQLIAQYIPFQSNATLQAALNEIGELCQRKSVRCILLNLPISQRAYSYITPGEESAYMTLLQTVMEKQHLPLWNFNTTECRAFLGQDSFHDINHLNAVGAKKFTEIVAAVYAQQMLGKTAPPFGRKGCAQVTP